MRTITTWNDEWTFVKPGAEKETVTLPHTWNAIDGTDGGNDYFRGTCTYTKTFKKSDLPEGARYFLEINGANSSADVVLNGKELIHHDGGYSTFRTELTEAVAEDNTLDIRVDNSANDHVYPQMADFTFYGGLYREVRLITVPKSHIALDDDGAPGIRVTPVVKDKDADVMIETVLADAEAGQKLTFTIKDADGRTVAEHTQDAADVSFATTIKDAHLWHGKKDPYLYTATVTLTDADGGTLDEVHARFGVRSYRIDPEKGFFLNGESYPLRGVSRHQDRKGIGNALTYAHHKEDIELIKEVGATTIRLAHYQHAQDFYDLCDEEGFVVWAEIPYISRHLPNGRDNTISQMTELIKQNYNHPSIVVWGLSNEITMGGADDPDLIDNHRVLNDLVHRLDSTRLSVMAVVSMCDIHAEYIQIPDAVSYNHYFGWYGGDTDMNGPWLDRFHETFPDIPIGMSEYGCEALDWHTSNPVQGDYTEEYQAYYHEELIKQLFSRPYLWATHVWNMFDFGADARNEGGENGQNHKGLVTFDRKYKKDAFYAYKAWLSDEPFVHLTGKRYTDRVEEETVVTVYSNLPEVELFVNGTSAGTQKADDHFFRFTVKNEGESTLRAVAGDCTDESVLRKVDTFPEKYRLKDTGSVLNWFDIEAPEGYFSLNDKFSDILKTPEGAAFVGQMMQQYAAGADNTKRNGMPTLEEEDRMKMLGGFTVLRMLSMSAIMGEPLKKEELLALNAQLNKIKKP